MAYQKYLSIRVTYTNMNVALRLTASCRDFLRRQVFSVINLSSDQESGCALILKRYALRLKNTQMAASIVYLYPLALLPIILKRFSKLRSSICRLSLARACTLSVFQRLTVVLTGLTPSPKFSPILPLARPQCLFVES